MPIDVIKIIQSLVNGRVGTSLRVAIVSVFVGVIFVIVFLFVLFLVVIFAGFSSQEDIGSLPRTSQP
jgi:hypothetical protein